ncbi:hypothetical protein H0H81_011835 [Sphagnurus paluster]|uniref:Uncharacterized protein n=1 Tax=Sphagnurus paluster TaxID=117069 RepID=A0A9P7GIW6_9AGAR|nr:hypothetical protein H0H81_011835 [Sphagnurus paluster]
MSPDTIHASSSWHSIRPWSPPLSLFVREITSVSVTFSLSSNLPDLNGDLEPLTALGLIVPSEEEDKEQIQEGEPSEAKKKSIISDALAKGLSVDVNGAPWQRVFIRIEDVADEAIIIIYGLMPGREYEIKLGLVQGESNVTLRTEENELESSEGPTDPESPDADHSTSSDPAPSTPSTSPNRTHPNTPPSTTTPLTAEDRLAHLQHALALINTDRDQLAASLKSARRDAQKADAALRSEIDVLKRASEKHVAADHRAKQKILSLQEAVKRAQVATCETEELLKEVEGLVPELDRQRQAKELEYAKVKEQAERARKDREKHVEKEKKRLEAMRGELGGLSNKMDKLTAKKEKLESVIIADLEEQLQNIQLEFEQAQKEAQSYTDATARQQEFSGEDVHHPEPIGEHSPAFPYLQMQRSLRTQLSPGTIGRPPPPVPIQRPAPSETSYTQPTLWSHPPRQRQVHNPRASSLQHPPTPTILTNPHRQSSLKSNGSTASSNSSPSAALPNSSPNVPLAATSTLSSRAPAFEPGRVLKNSSSSNGSIATGGSSGYPTVPVPIQRPRRSSSQKSKGNTHQGQWAGVLRSPYEDGRV